MTGVRRFLLAMVGLVVAVAVPLAPVVAAPYVPPAAADVPGYSVEALPCFVRHEGNDGSRSIFEVVCKGKELDGKTLRELAILRNTIYARYGWDGYRKQWLRDYFHAQRWFKPNAAFSYKLISKADRQNAHIIGSMEASFPEGALRQQYAEIYARHGKIWNDRYQWTWKNGKKTAACEKPKGYDGADDGSALENQSWDCTFQGLAWYHANPKFSENDITPDERIELGLISRALGGFATDEDSRGQAERSLDQLMALDDLRKLSLRDLRLLRNSIYARRGRPFKSAIIREHFQGMKWYAENPAYTDKLLSQTDVRNVRLIRSVEDELGGALRDEDWLIEPSLDGA